MQTDTVTVPADTPVGETTQTTEQHESAKVDKPLSIKDHAAQFGPEAKKAEPTDTATAETAKAHHSAEQKRDKENGQFKEGRERHRAESQKAKPEDVGRIGQLTARAKTAEERAERAERELAQLRAQGAPKAEIRAAERKVDAAGGFSEPEPQENDPKYANDYGKFMRDVAAWEGRKAYHEEKQRERDQQTQREKQTQQQTILKTFASGVEKARAKYADFDAVAFGPTPIRDGSLVDAYIMEDGDNGGELLYYLHHPKNRHELDALMARPELEQVKFLALLSQRLASNSGEQAGVTGAAASRETIVRVLPKPPTPVRTEAQARVEDPSADRPLSIAEHRKHYGKQLGPR